MRIIQLTDMHVGEEGEKTFDVDVRGNFLKALRTIRDNPPDHLVISGDLCYMSGITRIYDWMRDQLENFPCPVWYISGNHDDSEKLAKSLGLEHLLRGKELYYEATLGDRSIIFLDTSTYEVSQTQQQWLREILQKRTGTVDIFMHHPPALVGAPFMDQKYPLRNWAEMKALFLDYPGEVFVYCGHYHIEKNVHIKNLHIFVTPSTFFQIGQQSAEFQVDHYRIGWRELVWTEDAFQTTVRYID